MQIFNVRLTADDRQLMPHDSRTKN